MTQDKQLSNNQFDQVIEKRRLDQVLNAKESAVLAGVSYSTARAWFKEPGFPAFCGVVFWQDFVQWRNARTGLENANKPGFQSAENSRPVATKPVMKFTGKAAQLLAECG